MSTERTSPESRVRIACAQMEPTIGRKQENVGHTLDLIGEAAGEGADLVVLPELCNSGYVFENREEAFTMAEEVPGGDTTGKWITAAARHGMHVVAGIAERDGRALYNSAAVIGPRGFIGTYRKNHLWAAENLFFEPGNLGMPVFHTELGRIAAAICYDMWFPELFRLAAVQGADVLCVPTNWVPMPEQPSGLPMMANVLAMSGAHSNSMFVACADRIGEERGQPFIGSSLVVSYTGWPIAGPASPDREEMLLADVNLSDARRNRRLNDFNHLLRDRRTDLYAEGLGAEFTRGWY